MRQLSWTSRRVVPVVLVAVLAGSALTWVVLWVRGEAPSSLPACADLAGTRLGALGDDPAWNGCLTDEGVAVQSYRYECSGLRKIRPPNGEEEPFDWAQSPSHCGLDEVSLDLRTTQGCSRDGRYYASVGRTCVHPDFDTGVMWEQRSIEEPGSRGLDDAFVLESGPDEQRHMTVLARYRDERCSTPPDAWDPAWR